MSAKPSEQQPRSEKTDRATAVLALLQLVESVTALPDRRADVSLRAVVA